MPAMDCKTFKNKVNFNCTFCRELFEIARGKGFTHSTNSIQVLIYKIILFAHIYIYII